MLERSKLRAMSRELKAEPDNYMHSFRQNLFMYIEKKEITLAEVAEAADISVSTLKTFLYGDSMDCHLSNAIKLARVFNVSVDELVGSGTISPETRESLQIIRMLPESFTHFVRWTTRYHYDMLTKEKVTKKAIEIMAPEFEGGNLRSTNNFNLVDISHYNDDIRPKIFMGMFMPCDNYAPDYFEGEILLLANDRVARPSENVLLSVGGNLFIAKRKEEIVDGEKKCFYYNLRGDSKMMCDSDCMVIGYIAKVIRG